MNKDELIDKLRTHFFGVDEAGIDTGGQTLDGIKVWGIKVFELVGDVITRKNITFYTKEGVAYWGNFNPNPSIPGANFTDEINLFIAAKITEGIIKFGFITQISEPTEKALVSVITSANISKDAIISKTAETFDIDLL